MLDRSSPMPLYYQLRTSLLEQIQQGALKPGDPIPTERELIARFGVSRITVRQAVNSLMVDGLLYRRQGLGTFVRSARIEQELATLTGFAEEMIFRGLTPGARVISAEMREPESEVAAKLRLQPGEKVFCLVRVRLADGEPMALEVTQYPAEMGQRLAAENLEGSLYDLLEGKFGVVLDWADQTIESVLADETTARQLAVKRGTPVLLVERVTYGQDGRSLEYCRSLYRGDRYAYRIQLRRKARSLSQPPLPAAPIPPGT